MKPVSKKVIEVLNDVLAAELTAINQYFLHSEMCANWGYTKLHGIERGHAIDEMKHAEVVIERILHLEGLPNLQKLGRLNIGETVAEQLKSDYGLELEAVKRLNDGISVCRDAGDNATVELLTGILKSEEEHVDWIEAQLDLIKQVGEKNYLTQQI